LIMSPRGSETGTEASEKKTDNDSTSLVVSKSAESLPKLDMKTRHFLKRIKKESISNQKRISFIMKRHQKLNPLANGIGSWGGPIARQVKSPGPHNGIKYECKGLMSPKLNLTQKQMDEIMKDHGSIYLPEWDRNHTVAGSISKDPKEVIPVKDKLFRAEIKKFRTGELAIGLRNQLYEEAYISPELYEHVYEKRDNDAAGMTGVKMMRPKPTSPLKGDTTTSLTATSVETQDSISNIVTTVSEPMEDGLEKVHIRWIEEVVRLHATVQDLTYKDIVDIACLREPPEFVESMIGYISHLLGLKPTWAAAKRSMFHEIFSLLVFLTEVDPLCIPIRRIKLAVKLKKKDLLYLTEESSKGVCSSRSFMALAKWILQFNGMAKIILEAHKRKSYLKQMQMGVDSVASGSVLSADTAGDGDSLNKRNTDMASLGNPSQVLEGGLTTFSALEGGGSLSITASPSKVIGIRLNHGTSEFFEQLLHDDALWDLMNKDDYFALLSEKEKAIAMQANAEVAAKLAGYGMSTESTREKDTDASDILNDMSRISSENINGIPPESSSTVSHRKSVAQILGINAEEYKTRHTFVSSPTAGRHLNTGTTTTLTEEDEYDEYGNEDFEENEDEFKNKITIPQKPSEIVAAAKLHAKEEAKAKKGDDDDYGDDDFEDNDDDDEKHAAIVKLQALSRKRAAKKEVQEKKQQNAAAVKLQALQRSKLARKTVNTKRQEFDKKMKELDEKRSSEMRFSRKASILDTKKHKFHSDIEHGDVKEIHAVPHTAMSDLNELAGAYGHDRKKEGSDYYKSTGTDTLNILHDFAYNVHYHDKEHSEYHQSAAPAEATDTFHVAAEAGLEHSDHHLSREVDAAFLHQINELHSNEEGRVQGHKAATMMQKMSRARTAKKRVANIRKAKVDAEEFKAATKLQSIQRGRLAKKKVILIKEQKRALSGGDKTLFDDSANNSPTNKDLKSSKKRSKKGKHQEAEGNSEDEYDDDFDDFDDGFEDLDEGKSDILRKKIHETLDNIQSSPQASPLVRKRSQELVGDALFESIEMLSPTQSVRNVSSSSNPISMRGESPSMRTGPPKLNKLGPSKKMTLKFDEDGDAVGTKDVASYSTDGTASMISVKDKKPALIKKSSKPPMLNRSGLDQTGMISVKDHVEVKKAPPPMMRGMEKTKKMTLKFDENGDAMDTEDLETYSTQNHAGMISVKDHHE
jgi:hypothetical protein